MSTVNLAEVLGRLARDGRALDEALDQSSSGASPGSTSTAIWRLEQRRCCSRPRPGACRLGTMLVSRLRGCASLGRQRRSPLSKSVSHFPIHIVRRRTRTARRAERRTTAGSSYVERRLNQPAMLAAASSTSCSASCSPRPNPPATPTEQPAHVGWSTTGESRGGVAAFAIRLAWTAPRLSATPITRVATGAVASQRNLRRAGGRGSATGEKVGALRGRLSLRYRPILSRSRLHLRSES
jgi:hypothetical protein